MRQIICFLLLFMFTGTSNVNAQSKYIGGIFPTIDHTGKISKTFDYGLYYFGAFPFMNLKKSDSKNDVNLLLLYLEQSLTLNLNDKLQLSGSMFISVKMFLKITSLTKIVFIFKQPISIQ